MAFGGDCNTSDTSTGERTRFRLLSQAFSHTVNGCFQELTPQEVAESFPTITIQEYQEELHKILSQVLSHYRSAAMTEFEEMCSTLKVAAGLRFLEQLSAAQGVTGMGSAAAVTWNEPTDATSLTTLKTERLQLLREEHTKLVAIMKEEEASLETAKDELQVLQNTVADKVQSLQSLHLPITAE